MLQGSENHDPVPKVLIRSRSEKPLSILFGPYVVRCIEFFDTPQTSVPPFGRHFLGPLNISPLAVLVAAT